MPLLPAPRALLGLVLLGPLLSQGGPLGGSPPEPSTAVHRGPAVSPGTSGPARYVGPLLEAFDPERALRFTALVDRHYRAPANDGYEAALDLLIAELEAVGFRRPGSEVAPDAPAFLELRVIESELRTPAWTPLGARLEVASGGARGEVLHAFDSPEDRDRVMLPLNAPSAQVRGRVVLSPEELGQGAILVTRSPLASDLLRRARRAGAAAVISAALPGVNHDPSGAGRHLDAISFVTVPAGTELAVAQISPRSHARIVELMEAGAGLELLLEARVRFDQRPLRTLVASVVGARHPEQAVVLASHVQEPGAGDNASGVAGMLEGALAVARVIGEGKLERPPRGLDFVWGDEMRQSSLWLRHGGRTPLAAISADMLGQSTERTGAICLLERGKDPGAIWTLPPDEHTPWGKGRVEPADLSPDGLALIVRTALWDVADAVGGWRTAEHPWEGGSDHDVFLARGVPAVLLWHFTDFTYHTGLDRMEMLDAAELERSSVAVLAAALAVADARPEDLPRHLASLALERELRLRTAEAAGEPGAVTAWRDWFEGAEAWLRALCEPRAAPGSKEAGELEQDPPGDDR